MALENDVVNLLRHPNVTSIDLIVGATHIAGEDYEAIADGIQTGHISVERIEYSANAVYDARDNAIRLPIIGGLVVDSDNIFDLEDNRTVVHEATHAIMDARYFSGPAIMNETTAYCAGAHYWINAMRPSVVVPPVSDVMYHRAVELVLEAIYRARRLGGKARVSLGDAISIGNTVSNYVNDTGRHPYASVVHGEIIETSIPPEFRGIPGVTLRRPGPTGM